MPIIDPHTHILPRIDDGSDSISTSLQMLALEAQNGTDIVLATPHFYPERDQADAFLHRRHLAWERLSIAIRQAPQPLPTVRLGAEVCYYPNISRSQTLDCLCTEGTHTLLLELPFSPWTEILFEELSFLTMQRGFLVVIAHVERYRPFQRDKKQYLRLFSLPIFFQCNADSLMDWRKRHALLPLFRQDPPALLASDCHNLSTRPPNLGRARNLLQKKLGQSVLSSVDALSDRLFRPVSGGK